MDIKSEWFPLIIPPWVCLTKVVNLLVALLNLFNIDNKGIIVVTAKNTRISPNFLVGEFCVIYCKKSRLHL